MRQHKLQSLADRLARWLASVMCSLHGGRWTTTVDHDAGFILIRQRRER
jgi:hypothetical protein